MTQPPLQPNLAIIQTLIDNGADVNQVDSDQRSFQDYFHFGDIGGAGAQVQMWLMQVAERLDKYADAGPEEWYDLAGQMDFLDGTLGNDSSFQKFKSFLESLPDIDLSQASAEAALTRKQGDYAPMDNPKIWHQLDETIARLNEQGLQLNHNALLEEDGAPSELLRRAIAYNKVSELFAPENWRGASKADLKSVLNALPQEARDAIPNQHQLLADISREERLQQRSMG